jgi:hypothetical protein
VSKRSAPSPFVNLRSFCEFWTDERPGTACCQFVDQDVLDTDPDEFDCDTCVVRDRQADLWPENADAWRLYHQLVTRFLVDGQLLPVALTRLTADMTLEAFTDALDRLAVIYDVLQPPKAESAD